MNPVNLDLQWIYSESLLERNKEGSKRSPVWREEECGWVAGQQQCWPIRGECWGGAQGAADVGTSSDPGFSLGKWTGVWTESAVSLKSIISGPGSFVVVSLWLDVSEESTSFSLTYESLETESFASGRTAGTFRWALKDSKYLAPLLAMTVHCG